MYFYRPFFPPFPPSHGGHGHPSSPPYNSGSSSHQSGAPTSPPPNFTPQQSSAGLMAVDPGAISGCLHRYTYVWMQGWESFWFYPTYVGRRSVSGYRWTGFMWVYYGVDLKRIKSFQCF
ncbi:hypothetical protein [Bacillus taeanensis]|uniref:hypothetical protein n=1 Tax=Bacillus taeanensis TaxID=273032 RepID=UPI0015F0314A|nr:hypothetical protein [Bacillus taeanensis]